jgi:sugar phosphate isomerase/epimerase
VDRTGISTVKRKWSKQVKPQPQPLRPIFEEIAAEGYHMIEWRAPTSHGITVPETDLMADPKAAEEIRRLSEEFHIELAYHAPQGPLWEFGILPFQTAVSQLRECIRRSSSINAGIMTFHLGVSEDKQRIESIRRGAEIIQEVSPYAEDMGIWLCVENVFELDRCSVANVEECKILFEAADSARLRFTLDTGHANLYGCLYRLAEFFPEQLAFTHIHDNNGVSDEHRIPGRGIINWERLMSCFCRAGYAGPLNFELREDCTLPELIRIFDGLRI